MHRVKPRYCTACGRELVNRKAADREPVPYCRACRIPYYPAFPTAVLVAVVHGENVALLRQEHVSKTSWVLVAGHIEKGELAEAAVHREVREETGLAVEDCTYIASYYHHSRELLMLGFLAHTGETGFRFSGEVNEARWFPLESSSDLLRPGSIGREHLCRVAAYLAVCRP